jgi:hypothetical protein
MAIEDGYEAVAWLKVAEEHGDPIPQPAADVMRARAGHAGRQESMPEHRAH